MSTIYDVAEHAGVSPSTVSRTFSNSQRVNDTTRARVFDAAKTLGYQPKTQTSTATTDNTLMIGLVISDIQNPYAATVARGVQDMIAAEGYVSIICSTDNDPEKEVSILREMVRRDVDGFIITPSQFGVSERVDAYIRRLLDQGIPTVFIGNQFDAADASYVTSRAQDGAIHAVNYLAELGHRRIAFIGGQYTQGVAVGRWLGYQEAMIANGFPICPDWMVEGELSSEGGQQAMEKLLALSEAPTAVLTVNDLVAIGAMQRCQQSDVAIPAQMSIVGFDDIPLAKYTTPPLTTVAQPAYELGYQAAVLLMENFRNSETASRHLLLNSTLVVRDSAAAPSP